MGPYEHLCLSTFVRAGVRVQVFTYDEALDVPDGTVRIDGRDVLDSAAVFENPQQRGSFAAFSNVFRYQLLQMQDTTWIDTDVMLVGPGLPDRPYLMGYEDERYVNGAVLAAPRDSPFLAYLAREAAAIDPAKVRWGQLGPRLITRAVEALGLQGQVLPMEVLYPIAGPDVWRLFDPQSTDEVRGRIDGASTVHLWNEVIRRAGRVKGARPPRGSYLDEEFRALGVDPGPGEQLDLHWARTTWPSQIAAARSLRGRITSRVRRLAGR